MNLHTLINHPLKTFFDRKIHSCDIKPSEEEPKSVSITFRLPAEIKNYYQQMADTSRTSLQGVVLQVLGSVKDAHIIDQPAEEYTRLVSGRFFQIFETAGISIRKIPEFLKDFDVTYQDLTSNTRIAQLLCNDLLVDFLGQSFLISESWITGKINISHRESFCYKSTHTIFSLIQEAPKELTLRVLFDDDILSRHEIKDEISNRRYVHLALIEKAEINNISFNRAHLFRDLTWDYSKEHNTLAAVIDGMQHMVDAFQRPPKLRFMKLYAYDNNNIDRTNLGFAFLTDFVNFGKNNTAIVAGQPSPNIRTSSHEFKAVLDILESNLKKISKMYKDTNGELPETTYVKELEKLKKSELDDLFYLSGYGYHKGEVFPERLVLTKQQERHDKNKKNISA
jgi:hypothetical protein